MIEYLFAILLFFTLSVSLGFVAGCLAGRALERVDAVEMDIKGEILKEIGERTLKDAHDGKGVVW